MEEESKKVPKSDEKPQPQSGVTLQSIVMIVLMSLAFLTVMGGIFVGTAYYLEKVANAERAEDAEKFKKIKPLLDKALKAIMGMEKEDDLEELKKLEEPPTSDTQPPTSNVQLPNKP